MVRRMATLRRPDRGWMHSTRRQSLSGERNLAQVSFPARPAICARIATDCLPRGRQPRQMISSIGWIPTVLRIPKGSLDPPSGRSHGLPHCRRHRHLGLGPSCSPKSRQGQVPGHPPGNISSHWADGRNCGQSHGVVPAPQALQHLPQDMFFEWPPGGPP